MARTSKLFADNRRLCLTEFPLLMLSLIVVASIVGSPAQARTRDQVMSKAFGCAQIGDARTWLDCYYGAAQPARADLGLKPAEPAQVSLALSPPAGSAPQAADIRDAVLSGASRCSELDDERRWLDCYYAAAQPMRAYLNLLPASQLQAMVQRQASSNADRSARNAEDTFGFENDSSRSKSVSGRMTAYVFNKKGIFTVTLSNGQIWRQLSGDTSFAHWKEPPQRYSVRVSRGLLGSYNLQAANDPGMFKVHRIR